MQNESAQSRSNAGGTVENEQLLSEALTLMVLGMGTVYVFLILLVYLTASMSLLIKKFAPLQPSGQKPSGAAVQSEDPTLLAVITAAIHAHRNKQ
jgi:oxaloacetate decarboxylase gamma subunit